MNSISDSESGNALHGGRSRSWRVLLWPLVLLVVVLVGMLLYRFNPSETELYPKCVFFVATGWYCPGCGTARALHSLLHGRWLAAWHYNPLLLLRLPLLAVWGYYDVRQSWKGQPMPSWLHSWNFALAMMVIVCGYWIGRNLPWWPFCTWVPH